MEEIIKEIINTNWKKSIIDQDREGNYIYGYYTGTLNNNTRYYSIDSLIKIYTK